MIKKIKQTKKKGKLRENCSTNKIVAQKTIKNVAQDIDVAQYLIKILITKQKI